MFLGHDAPMRDRRLAGLGGNHAPAALLGALLRQRQFGRAFSLFRHTVQNAEIDFLDQPILEGLGEAGMRLGMPRQQEAARRVPVQPVHCARLPLEAEAQRAKHGHKAEAAALGCVDIQPGGLVDHQRFAVDEQGYRYFDHLPDVAGDRCKFKADQSISLAAVCATRRPR